MKRSTILAFMNGVIVSGVFLIHDSDSLISGLCCSVGVSVWVVVYKIINQ